MMNPTFAGENTSGNRAMRGCQLSLGEIVWPCGEWIRRTWPAY